MRPRLKFVKSFFSKRYSHIDIFEVLLLYLRQDGSGKLVPLTAPLSQHL